MFIFYNASKLFQIKINLFQMFIFYSRTTFNCYATMTYWNRTSTGLSCRREFYKSHMVTVCNISKSYSNNLLCIVSAVFFHIDSVCQSGTGCTLCAEHNNAQPPTTTDFYSNAFRTFAFVKRRSIWGLPVIEDKIFNLNWKLCVQWMKRFLLFMLLRKTHYMK